MITVFSRKIGGTRSADLPLHRPRLANFAKENQGFSAIGLEVSGLRLAGRDRGRIALIFRSARRTVVAVIYFCTNRKCTPPWGRDHPNHTASHVRCTCLHSAASRRVEITRLTAAIDDVLDAA